MGNTQEQKSLDPNRVRLGSSPLTRAYMTFIVKVGGERLEAIRQNSEDEYLAEIKKLPSTFIGNQNPLLWTQDRIIGTFAFAISKGFNDVTKEVLTPWTVQEVTNNLGLSSALTYPLNATPDTIPVIVERNNTNKYEHRMTQDLAFGILCITRLFDTIKLYIYTENEDRPDGLFPLLFIDIASNYIDVKRRYSADILDYNINFDNIQVIQGIITGCRWLRLDSKQFITNIREGQVLLTF